MASARSRPKHSWRLPAKGGVKTIENTFAPMRDGASLAVQLWLPDDAQAAPVVLEYIPYRKRDRYRAYGDYWGRTLAQYGVAYARLETRGTGDSTGVLEDEYLRGEQLDAVQAIGWLAEQPWCNGKVGMRGVSWGGLSTLQAAALAPAALAAIMPMCASDMRYTDDAHFVGGAFALTGLKWATSFKLVAAGPPDPLVTGEGWERAWRERLAATPAIAARWLGHQTNDAYWRQGSVGLDWAAIKCPVYVIGGLVDPYCNLIPRLLANLSVPRKGLLGPWRHGYPSPALPGPGLEWAFEEVRWWRQWLAGEDTGVMDEPMLRLYMPDATAAEVAPGPIPGRWVAVDSWSSLRVTPLSLYPADGGLHRAPQAVGAIEYAADKIVGLSAMEWVPFAPTELPTEQSADDARSLVFDTPALARDIEIVGAPTFRVRIASDRPIARVAVRLCEVSAEGQSWLVGHALLNLTHRDGHDSPEPLVPGRFYEVDMPLGFTAYRFKKGCKIRIALSEGLWPLVWPSPEPVVLTFDPSACRLDLPVRRPPAREAPMPIPMAPVRTENAEGWPAVDISEVDGVARVVETWPLSSDWIADIEETVSGSGPNVTLSMSAGDRASCAWRAEQSARFQRPGWDVALRAEVEIRATASHFLVRERTIATLNDERVAEFAHDAEIRRQLM
jgi:hypothetical protein